MTSVDQPAPGKNENPSLAEGRGKGSNGRLRIYISCNFLQAIKNMKLSGREKDSYSDCD
jgi:hypothetical protein